jgi:hypothetical protein
VVLKSSKDRILGVDTPEQHVPPCVQYGMACLLIRNVVGSMSCSVEWGLAQICVIYYVYCMNHLVQEEPCVGNP